MNVLTGDQIHQFRLLTLTKMLKLEIIGLKCSSGPTAYSILKKEFKLTGNRESVYKQARKLCLAIIPINKLTIEKGAEL